MNIVKARKILNKSKDELSDKDLVKLLDSLSNLADIFIAQQKGIVNYGKPTVQ